MRDGSSEISKGIDSSNGALQVIKENSGDITKGVSQIYENASGVADAMTTLRNKTDDLNEITSELSGLFSQFITD